MTSTGGDADPFCGPNEAGNTVDDGLFRLMAAGALC